MRSMTLRELDLTLPEGGILAWAAAHADPYRPAGCRAIGKTLRAAWRILSAETGDCSTAGYRVAVSEDAARAMLCSDEIKDEIKYGSNVFWSEKDGVTGYYGWAIRTDPSLPPGAIRVERDGGVELEITGVC